MLSDDHAMRLHRVLATFAHDNALMTCFVSSAKKTRISVVCKSLHRLSSQNFNTTHKSTLKIQNSAT